MSDQTIQGRERYLDKQGNPVTSDEWVNLRNDLNYTIIGNDLIGPYCCFTIWLGLNLNIFGLPPVIFKTMIFGDNKDDEFINYHEIPFTLVEAIECHKQVINLCEEAIKRKVNDMQD